MVVKNTDLLTKLLQIEEKIEHLEYMQDPEGEYSVNWRAPAPDVVAEYEEVVDLVGVGREDTLEELWRWKADRDGMAKYIKTTETRIKNLRDALKTVRSVGNLGLAEDAANRGLEQDHD